MAMPLWSENKHGPRYGQKIPGKRAHRLLSRRAARGRGSESAIGLNGSQKNQRGVKVSDFTRLYTREKDNTGLLCRAIAVVALHFEAIVVDLVRDLTGPRPQCESSAGMPTGRACAIQRWGRF